MKDLNKWHERFYRMAVREVAYWSKDPEAKVGCLIVSPDRRQWTGGYNGFPVGVADTDERLSDRELRNRLTVHAELNAILNARRDLSGWTLYVTKAPCTRCAMDIIQAGIRHVVCADIDQSSSWHYDQNEAANLLVEAGVVYTPMFPVEVG